jgi:hypothetical protein
MNPVDIASIGSTSTAASASGFELMLAALFVAIVTLALGHKESRRRR